MRTAHALELRRARKDDAASLAILVDIAAHGLALHTWNGLKEPWQSALEVGRGRAAREQGDFSYRNALMAEIDCAVAGALIDYRLADPYDTGDLSALPPAVRPLVMLESKAPGTWYVNVLAVFPEFRGQGVGRRLLAAAEEHARAAKASALSIIVAGENEGAVRLYTREGYSERARLPVVAFPGSPHGGDWVLLVKPTQ